MSLPSSLDTESRSAERSLFAVLLGDGTPLLTLTGLGLILAGGFALFLSATGSFLPHDVDYLGMTARDLCRVNQCRIVHFMIHDRVAFGGVLISIGTLYVWMAAFPLHAGERWAWQAFAVSGLAGFSSFLCYLGYGYLDTWHGAATLVLLPLYLGGMALSSRKLGAGTLRLWPAERPGTGKALLLLTALGQTGAGLVIMAVGMTIVFVPEDLSFIGMKTSELAAVNPRLIPLIAHDRAGFGGGLACSGVTMWLILCNARPALHLWQALLIAGGTGFACAIIVHFSIGYTDIIHLAPAYAGGLIYAVGMWLFLRDMRQHGLQ